MRRKERIRVDESLNLGTGSLTMKQVNFMLNHLPLELSFVDKDRIIQYFNNVPGEKLFNRTPTSIGRDMLYAHPPKSKGMVEKLLNDLETGVKDKQDAWYQKKDGTVVHITFAAVRDEVGNFLGVLEYVQDITDFTQLEGDNRDVNAK